MQFLIIEVSLTILSIKCSSNLKISEKKLNLIHSWLDTKHIYQKQYHYYNTYGNLYSASKLLWGLNGVFYKPQGYYLLSGLLNQK